MKAQRALLALLLLGATLLFVSMGAAASSPAGPLSAEVLRDRPVFVDVPVDGPFAEAISWMVEAGLTDGYGDGRFGPDVPVSRQAAAAFLHRLVSGGHRGPVGCDDAPFSDVDASHPFCGEIAWMARSGIAGGYDDGTFRPTAPVSRQAIASFLQRFASDPDSVAGCEADPFHDVRTDHRFCEVIAWLTGEGIAHGFHDGTFLPAVAVSRQAMAAFLHRVEPTSRNGVTISGGDDHTCWLDPDDRANCWGIHPGPHLEPPSGPFVQITTGTAQACGLRSDGTASCWGLLYAGPGDEPHDDYLKVPDGLFTQVVGGGFHACGLRVDGTATCWGHPEAMESFPPPGRFTELVAGEAFTCGLRPEGTPDCWWNTVPGEDPPGLPELVPVPSGTFEQLALNAANACGIRPGGAIECWTFDDVFPLGDGPYEDVTAGEYHACGLLASGEVECWSDLLSTGGVDLQDVPEGPFVEIAASWDWTCGRLVGGGVSCWNDHTTWDPATS